MKDADQHNSAPDKPRYPQPDSEDGSRPAGEPPESGDRRLTNGPVTGIAGAAEEFPAASVGGELHDRDDDAADDE